MIGIGDMMFGHLVAPEEDVIGGMAGRFTRKFVKERGACPRQLPTVIKQLRESVVVDKKDFL